MASSFSGRDEADKYAVYGNGLCSHPDYTKEIGCEEDAGEQSDQRYSPAAASFLLPHMESNYFDSSVDAQLEELQRVDSDSGAMERRNMMGMASDLAKVLEELFDRTLPMSQIVSQNDEAAKSAAAKFQCTNRLEQCKRKQTGYYKCFQRHYPTKYGRRVRSLNLPGKKKEYNAVSTYAHLRCGNSSNALGPCQVTAVAAQQGQLLKGCCCTQQTVPSNAARRRLTAGAHCVQRSSGRIEFSDATEMLDCIMKGLERLQARREEKQKASLKSAIREDTKVLENNAPNNFHSNPHHNNLANQITKNAPRQVRAVSNTSKLRACQCYRCEQQAERARSMSRALLGVSGSSFPHSRTSHSLNRAPTSKNSASELKSRTGRTKSVFQLWDNKFFDYMFT